MIILAREIGPWYKTLIYEVDGVRTAINFAQDVSFESVEFKLMSKQSDSHELLKMIPVKQSHNTSVKNDKTTKVKSCWK